VFDDDYFGFPLEPGETIGIVDERFGQNLQRDIAIQLRIAGAIHLAHAFTDRGGDLVRTKAGAGSQGHGVRRLYGDRARLNGRAEAHATKPERTATFGL
jgi:hypothetical protein